MKTTALINTLFQLLLHRGKARKATTAIEYLLRLLAVGCFDVGGKLAKLFLPRRYLALTKLEALLLDVLVDGKDLTKPLPQLLKLLNDRHLEAVIVCLTGLPDVDAGTRGNGRRVFIVTFVNCMVADGARLERTAKIYEKKLG